MRNKVVEFVFHVTRLERQNCYYAPIFFYYLICVSRLPNEYRILYMFPPHSPILKIQCMPFTPSK
jgi:hypothetical protein